MKTMRIFAGIVFLLTMGNFTFAHEGHDHGEGSQATMNQPTKAQTKTIEVGNTVCPVSGDKIGGKMGKPVKVAYKGKTYNLCCKMCLKDFKKDPAKYSKIAEEKAQKNTQ